MARILVVEDEKPLCKLISDWLMKDHTVDQVYDGEQALRALETGTFDVIILDWMLPELSGIEVCKRYRQGGGNAAVIMLTARHDLEHKATGFDAGADDYMTKPFQLRELAMRVRAVLRRTPSEHHFTFKFHDLVIDTERHLVTKHGQEIHLLPKEFKLLEFLLRHPQRVFSADELIDSVWEVDSSARYDTVRGHINRLRKKLDSSGHSSIIATVHGIGYKLGDEHAPSDAT
jgi:two-component system phosphate regulon response regulator PhoB